MSKNIFEFGIVLLVFTFELDDPVVVLDVLLAELLFVEAIENRLIKRS
jgi:hypothetical protein